jgi:hypothetical protein
MIADREETVTRQDKIIQMLKSQLRMYQMMGTTDMMNDSAKRMLTCDSDVSLVYYCRVHVAAALRSLKLRYSSTRQLSAKKCYETIWRNGSFL